MKNSNKNNKHPQALSYFFPIKTIFFYHHHSWEALEKDYMETFSRYVLYIKHIFHPIYLFFSQHFFFVFFCIYIFFFGSSLTPFYSEISLSLYYMVCPKFQLAALIFAHGIDYRMEIEKVYWSLINISWSINKLLFLKIHLFWKFELKIEL